jgi:hypothetical protein
VKSILWCSGISHPVTLQKTANALEECAVLIFRKEVPESGGGRFIFIP